MPPFSFAPSLLQVALLLYGAVKKLATVKSSKSSVTLKKLKGKKFSPKKNYYVYVVANKKVGKTTYTSGKHYSYKVKGVRGQLRRTFD